MGGKACSGSQAVHLLRGLAPGAPPCQSKSRQPRPCQQQELLLPASPALLVPAGMGGSLEARGGLPCVLRAGALEAQSAAALGI